MSDQQRMRQHRGGIRSDTRNGAKDHKGSAIKKDSKKGTGLSEQADSALLRQAIMAPHTASPDGLLALQRMVGNRAVSGMIQAKLMVGPAGDSYEQEADRIAEQVVNMPADTGQEVTANGANSVQRGPLEEEEIQTKPLVQRAAIPEEEEIQTKPLLQREPILEEEEIQMKSASLSEGFEAGSDIESSLSSKGGGSQLSDEVRAFMEPRFGVDFGAVRIHTDSNAAQMNNQINAQAFTHGHDIYMGAGRYEPGSETGKKLLAHELTHVVQQTGGSDLQRKAAGGLSNGKPVIQRHMNYQTFLDNTPGARRNKVTPIDRLMLQSEDLGNRGDLDAWHVWVDAVVAACDAYLAYPDKKAKRKPGVRALRAQVQAEKDFIDLMLATRGAATPKARLQAMIRMQEVEYQALAEETKQAVLNVFQREYYAAANLVTGTPAEREIIQEDLDRLQAMAANPATPPIVANVINEILGNVPATHLGTGMPMGAPTTPAEHGAGIAEQYSVKVPVFQSTGTAGRLAELGHELTHVAVSASFNNEPALAIAQVADEAAMHILRDARFARVQQLQGLNDADVELTASQKGLINEKLGYVLESKLDTYAKRFRTFGFISEARKLELVDIAARIPNNSLLMEFDSVINQILIFLQASNTPQGNPFFVLLRQVAQEAYDRRP